MCIYMYKSIKYKCIAYIVYRRTYMYIWYKYIYFVIYVYVCIYIWLSPVIYDYIYMVIWLSPPQGYCIMIMAFGCLRDGGFSTLCHSFGLDSMQRVLKTLKTFPEHGYLHPEDRVVSLSLYIYI